MISIKELLRRLSNSITNKEEKVIHNIIAQKTKNVNLSFLFPFYNDFKEVLDNYPKEYQIHLEYKKLNIEIKDVHALLYHMTNPPKYSINEFNEVKSACKNINVKGVFINKNVYMNTYVPQLVITHYHPKVTVTNENKKFVTLTNFFTRLIFSLKGNINSLYGAKSDFSYNEANVGYVHSHLVARQQDYTDFSQFCLGNGTPITVALMMLEETLCYKQPDFEMIKNSLHLLLLNVETVLKTESLSGVPHIKMEVLNTETTVNNILRTLVSCGENYLSYIVSYNSIMERCINKGYVSLINGKLYFSKSADDEIFAYYLQNRLSEINTINNINLHLIVKHNGAVVNPNAIQVKQPKFENISPIYFNGRKYPFTITNSSNYLQEELTFDFSENFKNYVRQYIQGLKNIYHRAVEIYEDQNSILEPER